MCAPACAKQKADLVLLMDQSGSINSNDYITMKTFMADLVGSFTLSEDLVRVGVAQFSSSPQKEFYLNQYKTGEEIKKHILAMVQQGGGTQIGRALDFIREYFQTSSGSRINSDVSQNLLLITDGESQDSVRHAAEVLSEMGVEIVAIGIGSVNAMELERITKHIFTVQDFGSLGNIRQKVFNTICQSKIKEESGEDCSPGSPEDARLSVCLSIHPSVCLSICLSARPSVCMSVCLSIGLSVFLWHYVILGIHNNINNTTLPSFEEKGLHRHYDSYK